MNHAVWALTGYGTSYFNRFVRGFALLLLLSALACRSRPLTVPEVPKEGPTIQDPWFGAGVHLAPHPRVDLAWAAPALDLRGQAVDLAAWEVPGTPGPGIQAGEYWTTKRDLVTHLLQDLAAEGIVLAQQPKPPPGTPAAYRIHGRVLAFDRQARVAAKTGQILGNIVLVPIDLVGIFTGHEPIFIGPVSGYRTGVLFQVKVVDLRTNGTVLALQSRTDFKSLEAPTDLVTAIWNLSGGEMAARDWWPTQELHKAGGDQVWFRPGLNLQGVRIRCLAWLPDFRLNGKVKERDLERNLQPIRMPRLLVESNDGIPGLNLSETEGTLYLQGLCPGPEGANLPTCRVKLWDPATGQVVGLMQVSKGFWRTDAEKDWARRIRRQLRAQSPNEIQPKH